MVVINDPNFSIPQICDSGQCFRLEPVGNGEYVLQAADRYLKIRTGRREQTEERGRGKMQRRTKVNHRRFSIALRRNITHSGRHIST